MTAPQIDVVLPIRARLGECPLWDDRQRVLWWIDIDSRRIHRTDPATGADEVCDIDGRPGSIVLAGGTVGGAGTRAALEAATLAGDAALHVVGACGEEFGVV